MEELNNSQILIDDYINEYILVGEKINNKTKLMYEISNNLLKSIWVEIDFEKLNIPEIKEQYNPIYRGDILLNNTEQEYFKLALGHRCNNFKPKKKIVIEPERVETNYGELFDIIKTNWMTQMMLLNEYVEFIGFIEEKNNIMGKIKSLYIDINEYATKLYKWYWNNKLCKMDNTELENIYLMFGRVKNLFVCDIYKAFNLLYVYDDYEISIWYEQNGYFKKKYYQFENKLFKLIFTRATRYLNGYNPKYDISSYDKTINKKLYITVELGYALSEKTDELFNDIIGFIDLYML